MKDREEVGAGVAGEEGGVHGEDAGGVGGEEAEGAEGGGRGVEGGKGGGAEGGVEGEGAGGVEAEVVLEVEELLTESKAGVRGEGRGGEEGGRERTEWTESGRADDGVGAAGKELGSTWRKRRRGEVEMEEHSILRKGGRQGEAPPPAPENTEMVTLSFCITAVNSVVYNKNI